MSDPTRFADFRAGAVKAPTQSTLSKRLGEFYSAFPEALAHRDALRLLGSDYVYAAPDPKDKKCWVVHIRFGRIIENLFAITREILAYYTPYRDLQVRAFQRLDSLVADASQPVTPDIRALFSHDPDTPKKVRDWEKGAVTTVPLTVPVGDSVDDAATIFANLAEFLSTRDLYYQTLPVTGDEFFGRRTMLLSILRDIREHRVCGVFGLRKSGKTSVVRQVIDALEDGESDWAVAFVDLETLPTPPASPIPTLVSRVSSELATAMKKFHLRTHELSHLSENASLEEFRRALKACLFDSDRKGTNVLLALDEIEFMLAGDLSDSSRADVAQFLAILRSLVQEHKTFLVLFSGLTNSIVEKGHLFGRPNPFYSWAKPYFVARLQRSEAQQLVTELGKRMALMWSDEALSGIYDATDGHPFYVRTLASSVVASMPPRQRLFEVDGSLVRDALAVWRRATAAHVREIFETLETYYADERTLLDIALDSQEDDLVDIAHVHPTEVAHLIYLGLISEDAGRISVGALPRLFPGRAPR